MAEVFTNRHDGHRPGQKAGNRGAGNYCFDGFMLL
jgi:hypothetical protein